MQKASGGIQKADRCRHLEITGVQLAQLPRIDDKQKDKRNARADGGKHGGGIVIVKVRHDDGIQAPYKDNEEQRKIVRAFSGEYKLFQRETSFRGCKNVRKRFYHNA